MKRVERVARIMVMATILVVLVIDMMIFVSCAIGRVHFP
jgi:hypothetical protein